MSKQIEKEEIEEIIVPTDLKTFLLDISDSRFGYRLGSPWKYSEESLGVVVPILRDNPPERQYVTMYEVLKELDIKDTGSISQVELQNNTGKAIFIRAGTIFTGTTQSRAAQHSGVYEKEKEIVDVRCVHASHGISSGAEMKFGDIAPPSVTINLMKGNQNDVWNSVRNFTSGSHHLTSTDRHESTEGLTHYFTAQRSSTRRAFGSIGMFAASHMGGARGGSDNLLGHLNKIKEGQSTLDDMMQRVPLFPDQVGAVLFNPVGVIAIETFDHPKSWESIKKEIIEKYGDKIKETQAEHLFELKEDMIMPMFRKFIETPFIEKTLYKDNYSETREVVGKGIVGEYTIVKGQPVHVLLLKEN